MLNRSLDSTLNRIMTLNRALDEAYTSSDGDNGSSRVWVPAIDVIEKREAYIVHSDLPGVHRSNVEITFEKNTLTISGRKTALIDGRDQEVRVFAAERVAGEFTRSLRLPDYIDAERISAAFKDGVLTVSVPKAQVAQPRRIELS